MVSSRSSASLDTGAGAEPLELVSWQVKRDLTGGALPAQVRSGSGIALAGGTVEIAVPDGRTPWTATKVQPGGVVTLDAAADLTDPLTRVGALRVRAVSAAGALTTRRSLSVEDVSPKVQMRLPQLLASMVDQGQVGTAPFDSVWVIDQAARACGFYSTPQPVPSALLCVHACGSPLPEVGTYWGASYGVRQYSWLTDYTGRCYSLLTAGGSGWPYYTLTGEIPVGASTFVTVNVTKPDTPTIRLADSSNRGIQVSFGFGPTTITSSLHHSGAASSVSMPTINARLDGRVQVQIERLSATEVRARARSAGGWSAWTTVTGTTVGPVVRFLHSDALSGLQVHTADEDAAMAYPTALLAAADSPLTALVAADTLDAWSTAQQVATATIGALWLAEDGVLTYRNRSQLRGGDGANAAPIVALESIEDLPWSISIDDVADRVEVSYQPADVQAVTTYSVTVWEAPSSIQLLPGRTVTLLADLDGAVDQLAPWLAATDTGTYPASRYSRWAASVQRDGGGTAPPLDALEVSAELLTPSRARIRIKNTTTGTLYTGGGSGTMALTLRANVLGRSGETVTVETGAPSATAAAPLQVSLAPWVQDDDTALSVMRWLADQTSSPSPTLDQVNVVPDLSVRLGDVRILRDPTHTALVSKVLVAGNDLSYSPGALKQTLRLVVLATLVRDVDELIADNFHGTAAGYLVSDVDAAIESKLGPTATVGEVIDWLERSYLA